MLLGLENSDPLFQRALRLQHHSAPSSRSRTESYQLHGLLRSGALAEAEELLRKHEQLNLPGLAGGFTFFYRVDLDRRAGRQTDDVRLQEDTRCYTQAFALLAAARQTGRSSHDAAILCDRSIAMLTQMIAHGAANADLTEGRNLLNLIRSGGALYRASVTNDECEWHAAAGAARDHISGLPSGAQTWFAKAMSHFPDGCNTASAEAFLDRLPYL